MLIKRPAFLKFILLGLIVFLATGFITAQDQSGRVYLLQNNQLMRLDETTGLQETIITQVMPTANVGRVDQRLLVADIDQKAQYIYLIEGWGRSINRKILNAPTNAELVQFNLSTSERKVIFDRSTVFNFVLSPDEKHMGVFFYDGEYMYATQKACILDLLSLQCQMLPFEWVATTGFWLDNQSFVIATNDLNPLRIIDINTGSATVLVLPDEWDIYWGATIPNTHKLIFSATLRSGDDEPAAFLTYDLDTDKTQRLSYNALNIENYRVVNRWNFSPDGKYLLYHGLGAALIEFETGQLLQEFDFVLSADWIDDHTLLAQGSRNNGELEIFQFDATIGQITTLLKGESASGVLLLP